MFIPPLTPGSLQLSEPNSHWNPLNVNYLIVTPHGKHPYAKMQKITFDIDVLEIIENTTQEEFERLIAAQNILKLIYKDE